MKRLTEDDAGRLMQENRIEREPHDKRKRGANASHILYEEIGRR